MTCVNLLFSPQKLNSNKTLQLNTGGFNAFRSPFPSKTAGSNKLTDHNCFVFGFPEGPVCFLFKRKALRPFLTEFSSSATVIR